MNAVDIINLAVNIVCVYSSGAYLIQFVLEKML